MSENAAAFPNSAPVLDAVDEVDHSASSFIARGEPGFQTMFEFDPRTQKLTWSDSHAAMAFFGVHDQSLLETLDDFNRMIVDGPDSERVTAFAGVTEGYACQYRLKRPNDETHWVEEHGGWIETVAGRRLISVIRSIEADRQRQDRLSWLATKDELTGLLNRPSLRAALEAHIAELRKTDGKAVYLLAGIDELGAINADFGFAEADRVIDEVGSRIVSVLDDDDIIGRVAGTKFGIILPNKSKEDVRLICNAVMNAVRQDVINTQKGGIAASICVGAISLVEFGDDVNNAMSRAEAALDSAKRLGKSNWSVFSESTDEVSMRRRNSHMSNVILTALNERRVLLAFQPIVADLDEVPKKFECLIRMRGEDGSEIPAPEFIPSAERLGLVHLLDRRVLELAINTLSICPDIHLNVNISMETVKDFVWAEGYLALLRANESLANRITVELTETQIIDAIDATIEFVSELKQLGCSFGIDDFGAGYTSFRNLKAMDIDTLKIDGSFVTGVSSSRENQLFVRTLLDLARNFGMQTVAEWVDNEADAILLKGLGVDYLQGFLLGKPEVNPNWLPEGAPNDPPSGPRG